MLHPQFAQAAYAIDAGRLEEASRLLSQAAIRDHRRAQDLIDRLIAAFVTRGQEHLATGNPSAAHADATAAKMWGGRQVSVMTLMQAASAAMRPTAEESPTDLRSNDSMSGMFLLQIDSLGRLLVKTGDVLRIGGQNVRGSCDVKMLTDAARSPLQIRRSGEDNDYSVSSDEPFRHNEQPVDRGLLSHRDSITLGSRGRLRFLRPVPASGTAIFELTDARTVDRDVRWVVCLEEAVIFGGTLPELSPSEPVGSHKDASVVSSAGLGYHFRLPALEGECLLVYEEERFWLRRRAVGLAQQLFSPMQRSELPLGELTEWGGVRWLMRPAGGLAARYSL